MIWSYSRIKTYEDCPYRFFLKYIKEYEDTDRFYSSFGKFVHELLEEFNRGELTKDEVLAKFLIDFSSNVRGIRPSEQTVQNYISSTSEYFRELKPLPFNTVAVEKEVSFNIDGYNFIGFIDYIGEKDNKLFIVDNKSHVSPRSGRVNPTAKD